MSNLEILEYAWAGYPRVRMYVAVTTFHISETSTATAYRVDAEGEDDGRMTVAKFDFRPSLSVLEGIAWQAAELAKAWEERNQHLL